MPVLRSVFPASNFVLQKLVASYNSEKPKGWRREWNTETKIMIARIAWCVVITLASLSPSTSAFAQIPRAYAAAAANDAYRNAEANRRLMLTQQLGLNESFRSYGLPWSAPYGETYYYGAYLRPPMPRWTSPYDPYLPYPAGYGGLIGYAGPPAPVIRQPIGQRQTQTGPNRWESYPIYGDEPVTPEPETYEATPPTATPMPAAPRSGPPRLTAPRESIETPVRRGPREF